MNFIKGKGQIVNLNYYSYWDKTVFFLYSMYFVMKPFYFWNSGLPQLSDFIMVSLIVLYIIKNKFKISYPKDQKYLIQTAFFFVVYVLFVNLIWIIILNNKDIFLVSSLFYIYNFFILFFVVVLYSNYKGKIFEVTYKATLISVLGQITMYFVNGGFSGGRMTVGFNNPNQLGYYALLIASILMLLSGKIKVRSKWFLIGVLSSLVLVASALSKAALLSFFGLLCFYLFTNNQNKKFKRNLAIIVIVFGVITSYIYQTMYLIQDSQLYQSVIMRLQDIGTDEDDSLVGRGYYRITEFPEYWLFGAGEGNYSRFGSHPIEFHSTLGNIQVSYGIIGLILFVLIIYFALKNNKYHGWYIILFLLTYGLTHNGIRNSLFWIVLALISVCNKDVQSRSESK